MTEGGPPTRTKRLGARFFKNPPQPHMCIQDYLQGSVQPCYVNVLSWDKIATANCPFDRLRLYGGMKITPPRTEKPMTTVFFVIANPEILRANGKTASDPKEQAMLIELLLDFIEAMNKGVIFRRQYKILSDIFIIGELKLIWELVQNDRAKVQNELQQSQIEDNNRKSLPQYPHYQNYQPPQHQEYHQQQQQQHGQSDNESLVKPPQYQASNNHWPPPPPPPLPPQHPSQEFTQNFHHQSAPNQWIPKDQASSSSSSSAGLAVEKNQLLLTEQNRCMYQYQQLSGQIFSYNVSKMHQKQNINPQMPIPIVNNCGQLQYMSYNNYHPENNVYVKVHRMQQPQQPQIQLAHGGGPQANPPMSIEDYYKDPGHMAPSYHHHHHHQINLQQQRSQSSEVPLSLPGQSNSPIRLLQRSVSADNPSMTAAKKVQVTDLDEDEPSAKINSNNKASLETGFYEIIQLPRTSQEKASSSNDSPGEKQQQQAGKMRILKRSKSLSDEKTVNRDVIKVLKNNDGGGEGEGRPEKVEVDCTNGQDNSHTQSAQERLVNAITQMSIKDCTDPGEFRSLLS